MKTKIIIWGAFVLLIISVIFIFGENINKESGGENSIFQKSEEKIENYLTVIKPNKIPSFKVGEKFIYKISYSNKPNTGIIEYNIESTERFNKTNCFLITAHYKSNTEGVMENPSYPSDEPSYKTCINISGYPLFVSMNVSSSEFSYEIYENDSNASDFLNSLSIEGFFYAPWMLSLTEDFKWKMNVTFPSITLIGRVNKSELKKTYYNVLCNIQVDDVVIEKTIGRECFKVKIDGKMKEVDEAASSSARSIRSTLWIDKEKRIIIKGIFYHENMPMGEIEIIKWT